MTISKYLPNPKYYIIFTVCRRDYAYKLMKYENCIEFDSKKSREPKTFDLITN